MKIKSDMRQAAGDRKRPSARNGLVAARHLSPVTRHSENGIALVITLILLSVTLVMAIAFLAISRRERGSVTTSTDTVTARLAADAALANAQAQIVATILATGNPYDPSLIVSTNYINESGFATTPATAYANPTNVNYFYPDGAPLDNADFEQNVANLLYLPRAPVLVVTNQQTGAGEYRFYLDLNRNGQFEDTGADITNVDDGNNILFSGGNPVVNNQTGDPQWIGVLERPDATHGPNNKFVSRYAFVAMPADGALDLNAIYNQATTKTVNPAVNAPDGYFRNQGVGSWEINLAAFLADLNTNQWDPPTVENALMEPYQYPAMVGGSVAFDDARSLLAYRYANNYGSLASASLIFPNNSLANGSVDIFPFGPVMTNATPPNYNFSLNNSWPGADNTNHFFNLSSDLFDPNKSSPNFTNRLSLADNGVSTYDRYTFYRLLAQMGTDSAPEQNQINLNYSNAVANFAFAGFTGNFLLSGVQVTNITYFPNAETNLTPWQPLQFFTIAADRLLREYTASWFQSDPTNYLLTYYGIIPTYSVYANGYGVTNVSAFNLGTNLVPSFGITNIPVLANGQFVYSSAVNRVLQLAANIYDATTNQTAAYGKNYPSVFRPVLYKEVSGAVTNVSIVGYQDVASYLERFPGNLISGNAPLDLPMDINSLPTRYTPANPLSVIAPAGNVYGVPWIIGVKKGFPNFNEFSMQDVVQVTRKLQVTRPDTNSLPNATNQMYVFSVTNSLGVEFWNSYTNAFTNLTSQIQVVVNDNLTMQMEASNVLTTAIIPLSADGFPLSESFLFNSQTNFNVWAANAFLVPFATNFPFLANSAYLFSGPSFYYVGNNPNPTFQSTTPAFAPLPQILLQVTNRLQAFILNNNHVIDYVQFTGPGSSRDLNSEFQNTNTTVASGGTEPYYTNLIWSSVLDNSGVIPLGIATQIGISDGSIGLNSKFWQNTRLTEDQIDGFRHFLNPTNASLYGTITNFTYSTNLAVQVPYTPSVVTYEYNTYQANDPLVHYLKSDLNYFGYDPNTSSSVQTGIHQLPMTTLGSGLNLLPDLGQVNVRYMPWTKTFPSGETDESGRLLVSQATIDENPYNPGFKDPLMKQSDNWDFPTNKLPTVGWLGRVHRGTPWQTVYLKATNILTELNPVNPALGNVGTNTWTMWTSDANYPDAVNSAPVQDRLLFDDFSTALNDNATRGQLSVNMGANGRPSLAAWSALLSGMVAITNSTLYPQFPQFQPLTNSFLIINPAGPAGNNSILGQIAVGINNMRAQYTNADGLGGVFEHVGDILSTPQLTQQSPFLNWNDVNQQQNGISDEVYEWLPQQMMSLLRVPGTPQSPTRYVIYSYGQTLQPAPNGVATGGGFFGMVTNYQVTAETVTRAVVQVNQVVTTDGNGYHTNYNTKIIQMNVLPPD